jgi:hypothetical protein
LRLLRLFFYLAVGTTHKTLTVLILPGAAVAWEWLQLVDSDRAIAVPRTAAHGAELPMGGCAILFLITMLRAELANAGIGPATVPAMRRFDSPPEPPRSEGPAGDLDDPRHILFEQLMRVARACREHPPDPSTASPMQLFAMYCFGGCAAAVPTL